MSVANSPSADSQVPTLSGEHHRTLHEIFRHPLSHNLTWREILSLVSALGSVEHTSDNTTTFKIGHERHHMQKPHTKDMTTPEMLELRHFLQRAGYAP
jgi:hypothetical protein